MAPKRRSPTVLSFSWLEVWDKARQLAQQHCPDMVRVVEDRCAAWPAAEAFADHVFMTVMRSCFCLCAACRVHGRYKSDLVGKGCDLGSRHCAQISSELLRASDQMANQAMETS